MMSVKCFELLREKCYKWLLLHPAEVVRLYNIREKQYSLTVYYKEFL